MKNLYFTYFFLLTYFLVCAQQNQGTPVKNLTGISRIGSTTESLTNMAAVSSPANLLLSPATTPTGNSPEVGTTQGELTVSLSGAANYSVPLMIPPGINGFIPQVGLNYNSQQGLSGTAARGWDISGVSSITRIPSTKFHDGIIDPVDFDAFDRYALDGQRLIVKNGGAYGGNGTQYETEFFSNIKITSYGVHPSGAKYGPAYFVVEYPNGAIAQFGNTSSQYGTTSESRSLTTWSITYLQNLQNLRINYLYAITNNVLRLTEISYGGQGNPGDNTLNTIQFTYKERENPEQYYIGDTSFTNSKILEKIWINSFGAGFKNYVLTTNTSDQITAITEKNGDNSKSLNPTVFTYGNTEENLTYKPITTGLDVASTVAYNASGFSGDFDGDGKMDCILYTGYNTAADAKYWLYYDIASGMNNSIGYTYPIGPFEKIFPTTWLSPNNKIVPNGWTVAKKNPTNYTFTVYSMGTVYPIYEQYTRVVNFPTVVVNTECDQICRVIPDKTRSEIFPKKIISGDFNGDGITDVIAIDTELSVGNSCTRVPITNPPSCGFMGYTKLASKKVYFIDLKSDNTDNYLVYAGELSVGLSTTAKIEIGDFNGDGRSDFYVFETGFVKIYSLNENNNLVLLYQNTVSDPVISFITSTGTGMPGSSGNKPFLMADYNGDGKTDFMIPNGVDSTIWYKYMSTGTSIIKETKTFATLPFKIGTYIYGAADYNNDNKADLLITRVYNITNNGLSGQMEIEYVVNKNGEFKSGAGYSFKANTGNNDFGASSPNILLYANQNSINYGASYNPSLEIAFFNKNKIHYFNSDKNYKKDNLLSNVTMGNGVQEAVTYIPLDQKYTGDSPYNRIYNSGTFTENYPNFDIQIEPNLFVVCKLEKQSTSVYKKKLFTYYNAVTNSQGLGFLGFRTVNQTDWHDDNTTLFSNIFKNDITLRGATTETFKAPYMYYPSSGGTTAPADFTSRSVFEYNSAADALQSNKVFKLKTINAKKYNGLEHTSTEMTNIVYDIYNNITSSNTYVKEVSSVNKTTTTNNTYENLTSPYIVGRPLSQTNNISITGSTASHEELYTYTNNLLTRIRKKGNNTGYITEDYEHDNFGNIITKTVTAPDPALPRINNYQYDSSGRFLIKFTDAERLETKYEYDPYTGVLKKVTSPLLLSSSYTYDSWLKKLTAKNDNLNKMVKFSYVKNYDKTIFTATGDSGEETYIEETYDDLGRKVKTGVKNVNGNISYVSYLYDLHDWNIKISEPYFGANPTLWNETKFDIYGRPVQDNSFNSRSSSAIYSGLETTFKDGLKTKIGTRNAIGNIVSMQENTGGIINYTYSADGNLTRTTSNGSDIKIEQDGWGRNEKLTDPTSGEYSYDCNDLGELKSETSSNGAITTLTRDAAGRISKKTVIGPYTDSETTYEYDSMKLLTLITFVDHLQPNGYNTIITSASYDPVLKKMLTVIEDKVGYAKFTRTFTYDNIGRVQTESKKAEAGMKSSVVTMKYVYQYGSLYQIKDNSTSKVLWQANSLNAKGQVIENIIGNGIKMTNTYDTDGYLSKIQHDKATTPAENIITITTEFDKTNDNLKNRTNSTFGNWTETFKYDDLDRLTEFTNVNGAQEMQNYEASGKIKDNSLGTYNYAAAAKPNQNTSITITPETAAYYANREGMYNNSMEDKTGWGSQAYPNNIFYSYDNSKSRTGTTSLKFTNTTSVEQYVHADKWIPIDNTEATEYTYSVWVYSDGPQAQMFLFMNTATETGYFSAIDNVTTSVTNQWIKLEGTVLVPANINKINIRLDNNGQGNIWFDDVQIRKTSVASAERKLIVEYNAFKSPSKIEETGIDKINFTYNENNQRSTMFYGGFEDNAIRQYRKHYSADGSMEIKENTKTGNLEFVTYIGGDAYSAPIVAKSDGIGAANYLYLHRDYQGSIMAITDANALLVEKRLFDAWGNIAKVQDGSGNSLNCLTVLDRGYTGHEHLQSVGLINMNARLYDPKLHRFLSVDNYVQDPLNTQNYNQYGYVMNNPNKYVDFSGNFTQKNGYVDPKSPTQPTELQEVIVSRRSPAASADVSYGPSLVMSPLPVSNVNINGAGNRNLQKASLFDGNVTGFDIVNVGIGIAGIAIVNVQNAMSEEAQILKNKNTLTSLGKLANLKYSMVGVDKFAQRLGVAGAVLTTGKVAMDYFNGKDITAGQLFDIGVAVGLAAITISNPVALVGFGVYGLLDATGALDSIKSSLGGDTVVLKSNY